MRFGFHVSIAGGLHYAFDRACELGCETMQIFSRNPRGWKFRVPDEDDVSEFRRKHRETGISPVAIHMPYLPNLASPDRILHRMSVESLAEDLRRAVAIGAEYVVTHVGKGLGLTEKAAIRKVVSAIDEAIEKAGTEKAMLLLENTAGQGSEIGRSVEQLAAIVETSRHPARLGLCFDTCHGFAAGYDVSSAGGLDTLVSLIDSELGLERLRLLHLNDSLGGLGCVRDRHENIGKGRIGRKGFRLIVNHLRLHNLPGIMETPLRKPGDDVANMKAIRALVRKERRGMASKGRVWQK
jgi:deoxyribonuclease-4